MKKKCVFIIPYFGQFKNYFSLFLESCAYNTDFDWIIFTDNEDSFDYSRNVKKIQMTFEKFTRKNLSLKLALMRHINYAIINRHTDTYSRK